VEYPHPSLSLDSPSQHTPFLWSSPDLSIGKAFYHASVASLGLATGTLADSEDVFVDGMVALEFHRGNYTPNGQSTCRLHLFWWEFPHEHWDKLCMGGRMNFLSETNQVIQPNANMSDEEVQVAGAFVDELIDLHVVNTPEEV
jgi:hypothetical protein